MSIESRRTARAERNATRRKTIARYIGLSLSLQAILVGAKYLLSPTCEEEIPNTCERITQVEPSHFQQMDVPSDLLLSDVYLLRDKPFENYYSFSNSFIVNGIGNEDATLANEWLTTYYESELSKYTPAFVNQVSHLNSQLVIVDDAKFFLKREPEWLSVGGTVIILDKRPTIVISQNTSTASVHHEFAHLLALNLKLPEDSPIKHIYETFAAIQEKYSLTYKEGMVLDDIRMCNEAIPEPGYQSCYGSWNIHEDFATIATEIMVGTSSFYKKLDADPALQEKVAAVMDFYEYLSNGTMNREYFRFIAEHYAAWEQSKAPQYP